MNARRSRLVRRIRARAEAARVSELLRVHEISVDEAYESANRVELREVTVAGDALLGSLVDELVDAQHAEARAAARKVEQVYAIRKHTELNTPVSTSDGMRPWSQAATARRVAVSEVAAALTIPDRTAEGLIEESRMLMEQLPATMAGLRAGDFSFRHAKSVVAHARALPDELHAEFEATLLSFATKLTVSKFDQKARTQRERMDATTIRERHKKSLADRETYFEPAPNGMGWVHLYSSATVTLAASNRADEMARDLRERPDEERTLTQLRADVVADLLLDGVVGDRPEFSIRPSVVVTVPALALLDHRPGSKGGVGGAEVALPVLEGYGPIDPDTAKRLAGSAKSWLRVLTHPETGVTLSVGRDRYKVPAPLRAWLRLHDGTCRKPGCNRPAIRCDIDHTQEWQHGGQTAHDNLAHLCQQHHNEKHHTPATVRQLPNGELQWTLASGRSYVSEPADRFVRSGDFLNPVDARDPSVGDTEFENIEFEDIDFENIDFEVLELDDLGFSSAA
jgi:hypothetical protein